MKAIVQKYFELRKQFPRMSPASAWFHASVEADVIDVQARIVEVTA